MKKLFKFPSFKVFGLILGIELLIIAVCCILLACFNVSQYFDIVIYEELPLHIRIVITIFSLDLIFMVFALICLVFKIYFDKSYKD